MYDHFTTNPGSVIKELQCEIKVTLDGGVSKKVKGTGYQLGKTKTLEIHFDPPVSSSRVRIEVNALLFPPSNALESIKRVQVFEKISMTSEFIRGGRVSYFSPFIYREMFSGAWKR